MPLAAPEMVYHCRCKLTSALVRYPRQNASRRDNTTGEVIPEQSYQEWLKSKKIQANDEAQKIDFMGASRNFSDRNGAISIKAYQVKGHHTIFTQTNSKDAQATIKLISDNSAEIQQLQTVSEIIVAKDVPGIAAYDHVDNRLYVNERISSDDFIEEQLSGGYFVAENAKDILRHEMHHKDHWDYISARALTSGKSSDIVKQEIEADLREYVQNQLASDPAYIRDTVSKNAEQCFNVKHSLNELIADSLLQGDKGAASDSMLIAFTRRCVG